MCFIGLLKVEKVVPKAIWSWLSLNTDGEEPIFYSLASIPCTEFLMDMECEASFTCHLEGLKDLLFKLPYCAWCTIFQKKSEHFQCRAGLVRIIKSLAHK